MPTPEALTTEGGEACPICRAEATTGAVFPEYQLFGCDNCGCWSSSALARGADTSFETHNYFANADLDRPKWDRLLSELQREGRPLQSLLDVGCGTGAYLAFVAREYPEVRCEGIELDEGRAEQARLANPAARIHVGEASSVLEAGAGPFDLITLWDVFEHVSDPARLLCQLAECLTPRGSIHIVTINERSVLPLLGRFSYWLSAGSLPYPVRRTHEAHHLVFFTRKGLDLAIARAGLVMRDLWYDRLLRGRMDGHPVVTAATASLLRLENAFGNGLFFNLTLGRPG